MSDAITARIVIVAFRSDEVILECLQSLDIQTDTRFEVVVVNNDESSDFLTKLPVFKFSINILCPKVNLGFAGGCNFGAKGTKSPWLIMLNPDTRVAVDWFENIMKSALKYPNTDAWASTLIQNNNSDKLDGFGDVMSIYGVAWRGGYGQQRSLSPKEDLIIFGACGAAAAYRRSVFEEIGGFDSNYFCFLEDVDIALRLNLSKHTTRISHKSIVNHIGGSSTEPNSEFPVTQTFKNNAYLLIKNLPLHLLFLMFPLYMIFQTWVIIRNRHDGFNKARKTGRRLGIKRLRQAWNARGSVVRKPGASIFLWKRLCKSYLKLRKNDFYYINSRSDSVGKSN